MVSLTKRADFLLVQKEGDKWISKSMIVQIRPNDQKGQRTGLIVTKKLFKLAVDRNRTKRRLRAVIAEILPHQAPDHYDYVFIARKETICAPYEQLKKDCTWCLKRLGVLIEQEVGDENLS